MENPSATNTKPILGKKGKWTLGCFGALLVFLFLVLPVLGVFGAIIIPWFVSERNDAIDATVEADVRAASTQVNTWHMTHEGSLKEMREYVADVTADDLGVDPSDPELFLSLDQWADFTGEEPLATGDQTVIAVYPNSGDTKKGICLSGWASTSEESAEMTDQVFADLDGVYIGQQVLTGDSACQSMFSQK